MMVLKEWLRRVGLVRGNPFAMKEADKEVDLQSYVVVHPAFNEILDDDQQPVSSVLHAPRGAGKSTMRRMFEEHYRPVGASSRVLLIALTDWMPIVVQQDAGAFSQAQPHYEAIAVQFIRALAADDRLSPSAPSEVLGNYLAWLFGCYKNELTVDEHERLARRFPWLEALVPAVAAYNPTQLPVVRRLRMLTEIARMLDYRVCYLLIDHIDELIDTVADWERGADLIEPLIGNLPLMEIPDLAVKCFIPSEIVAVLQRRGTLRVDRLHAISISWDTDHLLELLQSRLDFYSNGVIKRLAELAVPSARDVDGLLVGAAHGSPRMLLNLGDALVRACTATAEPGRWQLEPEHLARIFGRTSLQIGEGSDEPPRPDSTSMAAQDQSIPPLRISGGRLWLGEREHTKWQDLPDMQRRLLDYLYRYRGKICRKEDILRELWREHIPADDGSLRKLGERLIESIEPSPEKPKYIRKIRGGHFRLDNTGD